jgi:hypothetical protein
MHPLGVTLSATTRMGQVGGILATHAVTDTYICAYYRQNPNPPLFISTGDLPASKMLELFN